ncbi:MAG: hydratase, partial [Fusobacteriaceae bacterium]|nr:hydratase [Fusobacteriaceae bacterium]
KSPVGADPDLAGIFEKVAALPGQSGIDPAQTEIGSAIYARKPGDGSAREQAASSQRVLGGLANIASEYATKRYRSNLLNWGMIPFLLSGEPDFAVGDWIYVPGIKSALNGDTRAIKAWVLSGTSREITLSIAPLTDAEKRILKAGSLINDNKK